MTLTAALLAGGLSRRMGADKATLQFEGEQLWERQLRVLRSLRPDALLISARARPAWCPPGIEAVADEVPSQGPLSGLVALLRRIETSHLLVLAIDMPRMSTEHLQTLRMLAQPGKGIIPFNHDYFEPLCAIYPAGAGPIAVELLAAGHLSLQHFTKILAQRGLVKKHFPDETEIPLYHNLNTPGDLREKTAEPFRSFPSNCRSRPIRSGML